MFPECLERIESLYHSALERAESERAAFLRGACGGDEVLRREVESLLGYRTKAEKFIESPALEAAARSLARCQILAGRGGADWKLGKTISHYRILERLGAGGMGVVYKAQDTVLGRFVALKFLTEFAPWADDASARGPAERPPLRYDSRALERLKREARAASAIDHPNICTIHEIGEYERQPFIVMQFLEGQTLKDRIFGRPLAPDEFIDHALAIGDALEAAHAKGILHRDIKPANIFLTSRGEIKVLDFGLAKAVRNLKADAVTSYRLPLTIGDPRTDTGLCAGTAPYMSPEQVRGEELDARSDLFSFGVVLYEMATGRQPFRGNTTAAIFDAILNRPPKPPANLNPALPQAVGRIVMKALQRDRNLRYRSAAEMRTDLECLKRGGAARKAALWSGARRKKLVAVGLVALAPIAASSLYVHRLAPPKLAGNAPLVAAGMPAGPGESPVSVDDPGKIPPFQESICRQGFVWREAFAGDKVCVLPEIRIQAKEDNMAAPSRVDSHGRSGPKSCVQGYVWREAGPVDQVCVTPATREQTEADNTAAKSRQL